MPVSTPPRPPIQHPGEPESNRHRAAALAAEPRSLRTFTPTQAVLARSAGACHWTPEGRRLWDFTSGVLVANLGHNSVSWMRRFGAHMRWPETLPTDGADYFPALAMTSYNAVTPLEAEASRRLLDCLRSRPGGGRMEIGRAHV